MARTARSEVFDHTETNCIFTECTVAPGRQLARVQSQFSADPDSRRAFVIEVLEVFRKYFALELIAYTFDGKSIRQILQPQPALAKQLSPNEVARRWLIICPSLRRHDAPLHEPSEKDIVRLCDDPSRIDRIRRQLSDVAWWNRLLSQRIAQNFNMWDNLRGRFWEGRFRSILLLDDLSRLTCLASIETANRSSGSDAANVIAVSMESRLGQSNDGNACSPSIQLRTKDVLSLLDWTYQFLANTPTDAQLKNTVSVALQRRNITTAIWIRLVIDFSYHFSQIAGRLETMDLYVSRVSGRRFYVRPQARALLRPQYSKMSQP